MIASNSNVRRLPAQMRVIDCTRPLSDFVHLGPCATGDFGWLQMVGALLTKQGAERGEILLLAFRKGRGSLLFPGRCIEVPNQTLPEMAIAAAASKRGMPLEGCGLYVTQFPGLESATFFVRAGITDLWYVHAKGLRQSTLVTLKEAGVRVTHVDPR